MILRRLLFCLGLPLLVLLITGLGSAFLSGCASALIDTTGHVDAGITYYTPPKDCPVADGSTWRYEPTWTKATKVLWVQLQPGQDTCGSAPAAPGWGGPKACGFTPPGSDVGIVYSTVPRYALTEAYIQHEECHTQGWNHGPHHGGAQ